MTEPEIKKTLKTIDIKSSKEFKTKLDTRLKYESLNHSEVQIGSNFYFLSNFFMKGKVFFSTLAVSTLVIAGTGFATVSAARNSKPGDALFGLNKSIDSIERSFINDDAKKVEFEQELFDDRANDLAEIEKENDKDKFETAKKEFELQYEKLKKALEDCDDCEEQKQILEKQFEIDKQEFEDQDSEDSVDDSDDSNDDLNDNSSEDLNDDSSDDSNEVEDSEDRSDEDTEDVKVEDSEDEEDTEDESTED